MGYLLFYSMLEGFQTNFENYFKLVHYSSYGSDFQTMLKYFQIIIFENPYNQRAVGWDTMPCMLKIENLFKHVHEREVAMRYT